MRKSLPANEKAPFFKLLIVELSTSFYTDFGI